MNALVIAFSLALIVVGVTAHAQEQTALTNDEQALEFEALYTEAERLRRAIGIDLDISKAFEIHKQLADAGYGRSLHRVGDFHYRGIVVPQDYGRAATYYQLAVEAGNTTSILAQSKALRRAGDGERALEVIDRAIVQIIDGALEERAAGHLYSEYGTLSDPSFGYSEARRLSEAGNNQVATYLLAEATHRGLGTQVDDREAFKLFMNLYLEGHAAGTERLANYFAEGIVVDRDPERAVELYRIAAGLGREGAYLPMIRLLSELGQEDEALMAAEEAIEEEAERAELEFALGHIDGLFGTESDPEFGWLELNRLAEQGDMRAAATLLDRVGARSELVRRLDVVIATLDAAVQRGNGRAAETLLRFYREAPKAVENSFELRQQILENHAGIIRSRVLYPEMASLAFDSDTTIDVFPLLLEIVEAADGDGYERALLQIFWRDKNAFTYVLQRELSDQGRFEGRPDGRMNRSTLRATLGYCREKGIGDECAHGPLRTPAVRLIATALRRDRDIDIAGERSQ